jgi:outer membrane biosynthesis protein TonB
MNGTVRVEVLIDPTGHVACAHAINGHPILISSAIDAARQWTFRPIKHGNLPVAFYGSLLFIYSTETTPVKGNSCLLAHW